MNKPESVVGCSTCGALYTPAPGDRGVCSACSAFQLDEPPAQAAAPAPRPTSSGRAASGGFTRTGAGGARRRGRALRIAAASMALAAVAALGAAFLWRRPMVTGVWTSIQRRFPSDSWDAVRRLASNGWTTARRHLPFESLQGEQSASVAPGKTSRVAVRDGSEARGSHRRTKAVAKK